MEQALNKIWKDPLMSEPHHLSPPYSHLNVASSSQLAIWEAIGVVDRTAKELPPSAVNSPKCAAPNESSTHLSPFSSSPENLVSDWEPTPPRRASVEDTDEEGATDAPNSLTTDGQPFGSTASILALHNFRSPTVKNTNGGRMESFNGASTSQVSNEIQKSAQLTPMQRPNKLQEDVVDRTHASKHVSISFVTVGEQERKDSQQVRSMPLRAGKETDKHAELTRCAPKPPVPHSENNHIVRSWATASFLSRHRPHKSDKTRRPALRSSMSESARSTEKESSVKLSQEVLPFVLPKVVPSEVSKPPAVMAFPTMTTVTKTWHRALDIRRQAVGFEHLLLGKSDLLRGGSAQTP
jgi:hypothetical protein